MEEINALCFGLKHHILPKEIDILKLKSAVENYTDKLLKVHEVSSDHEFTDVLKFIALAFSKASRSRCRSRFNQALHNCLSKLTENQTIKIL